MVYWFPDFPRRRGRLLPGLALVGVSLAIVLAGLLVSRLHGPLPAGATALAEPAATPLLILRPQVTHLAAALGHGIVPSGVLDPTLPGLNTVRVAPWLPLGVTQRGQIALAATKRGMTMPPSRAVLQRGHGGEFTGTIRLPMFGDYRVVVTLHTPAGRATGTFPLALPFPQC